jgi:hypothetical protein
MIDLLHIFIYTHTSYHSKQNSSNTVRFLKKAAAFIKNESSFRKIRRLVIANVTFKKIIVSYSQKVYPIKQHKLSTIMHYQSLFRNLSIQDNSVMNSYLMDPLWWQEQVKIFRPTRKSILIQEKNTFPREGRFVNKDDTISFWNT